MNKCSDGKSTEAPVLLPEDTEARGVCVHNLEIMWDVCYFGACGMRCAEYHLLTRAKQSCCHAIFAGQCVLGVCRNEIYGGSGAVARRYRRACGSNSRRCR